MFISAQRLAKLGSWIWDIGTDRLIWSEQTYELLGLSTDDFDGTLEGFFSFVHPDDRPALRDTLRQVYGGMRQYSYRYRCCGRDGRERVIEGDGEAQFDSDGSLLRLIGTVMDVTPRERERQAIVHSEARFRSLVALSSDWYWEQDAEFRFTRFAGGREMREEQRSDMVGKCRWDLAAMPMGWTWEEHRAALVAREPFRDLVYLLADGRYIRISGEPFYDVNGGFLGYRGTAADLTGSMRAEEHLRQSHAMLRMAMRVGRIGAWSLQWPKRAVTWAEGGRAIHTLGGGITRTLDEVLERVAPGSRAGLLAALEACAQQCRRFEVEVQLREGALPAAWMRLVGECNGGAGGACVLHGTMEDITERKLAAERMRELGSRLVATLDTATDCFVTVNRDWCFTYLNQEAERLLSRSRDELLGRNMWQEFPESVGSRFEQEYRRAVARQETVEFDEYYSPFGQWLRVKASPSPQGLAIYFRDITDSLSMRDALADSQRQLHRLFEHTTDGVLHVADDNRILDANPAACRMLGRSRQALLESSTTPGALGGREIGELLARCASIGQARGEFPMRRADGGVFECEVSSIGYGDAGGAQRAFVVFRDISGRLRAQREILALNSALELRVAQRTVELESVNAELKAFAHSLAHDLRSPIAAIDGFSEMLARTLPAPLPERASHYLGRIRAAAGKMDAYTTGLLSLARISQAQLHAQQVDLSAMAEDLLQQLQEQDPGRPVTTHVQPLLAAHGDAALLRMALENLLGNAWKFTSRCDNAEIEFGAQADAAEGCVYYVRDNGAGFDMAIAGKLFGSFQRLHTQSEFPGTGIGLANVQRVVARHGGRIWAEAAEGAGATFYFTLPGLPLSPA